MTLSNIFFGKKVVKQAYLNNALIYQSNGWETLPSTCTKVWEKDYNINSDLKMLITDVDNNIFAINNSNLYKFDQDGNVLWQKQVADNGYNLTMLKKDKTTNNMFIVESNISDKNTQLHLLITEYNNNGEKVNDYDILKICQLSINTISSVAIDSRYLFISVFYMDSSYNHSNEYLIKIDKIAKEVVQKTNVFIANNTLVNFSNTCLCTEVNDSFSSGVLKRFDKDDLSNSSTIDTLGNANSDYNITSMITDEFGNLIYKTNNNGIFKYSISNNTKIVLPVNPNNENNSLCIDNEQNVYVIEYIRSSSITNLVKISSDNTLIYRIVITDSINPNLVVDQLGNIYYTWTYENQTHITKLINLVKET